MFLIFTVPLALFLLDILAVALSVQFYRYIRGPKRQEVPATSLSRKILLWTGACQLGWCGLVLVADMAAHLGNSSNEMALQLLLLSSFVIPPVLLIVMHRHLSTF